MLKVPGLVLVFALSALALPKRDVLGLLTGDSSASPSTHSALHSLKPTTNTSSHSPKPTLDTSSQQQWSPTPTPSAHPTTVQTTLATTPVLPTSAESHDSGRTWQIIGIAIIAVLFIAASITCAMCFDRLWRFLKDVICCTSHPALSEEFIPDCEKQNWDHTAESLHEAASLHTIRTRELPWDADWNTLHRHPSRRNDHPPAA